MGRLSMAAKSLWGWPCGPFPGTSAGTHTFRLAVMWVSPKVPTYVKVQETTGSAEGSLCSPGLRDRAPPSPPLPRLLSWGLPFWPYADGQGPREGD